MEIFDKYFFVIADVFSFFFSFFHFSFFFRHSGGIVLIFFLKNNNSAECSVPVPPPPPILKRTNTKLGYLGDWTVKPLACNQNNPGSVLVANKQEISGHHQK